MIGRWMKLLILSLAASTAFAADWNTVERIAPGSKIEVTTRDGKRSRAQILSATSERLC